MQLNSHYIHPEVYSLILNPVIFNQDQNKQSKMWKETVTKKNYFTPKCPR